MSFSLISQEKIPGFCLLSSSIRASTSGVATLGLDPPITPGLMEPVSQAKVIVVLLKVGSNFKHHFSMFFFVFTIILCCQYGKRNFCVLEYCILIDRVLYSNKDCFKGLSPRSSQHRKCLSRNPKMLDNSIIFFGDPKVEFKQFCYQYLLNKDVSESFYLLM